MQAYEVNHELLDYCSVAATAARKKKSGLISDDELGHLLQLQIRLARIMVEEAMQQVGAKVGTAAFIDLVDFPGSIVHMFAGDTTADGAADRVIQTLERSLTKDAAGVMIQKLLCMISFDRVLAHCLRAHIDADLKALLPRTLHAVQLLAATGGELARRFASEDMDVIGMLMHLLEVHCITEKQNASLEKNNDLSVAGAAVEGDVGNSGTAAASSTDDDVGAATLPPDEEGTREDVLRGRDAVVHRAAAALINLALAVPDLRNALAEAPAMQAAVTECFASHRASTMMVALAYVSTLACTSETRKALMLENGVALAVTHCLSPTRSAPIRLKALLALRNLVWGNKARQLRLLTIAPDTIHQLQMLAQARSLKAAFLERADDPEKEVRKEAKLLCKTLEQAHAQQPQIDLIKSELTSLRAKAMEWAVENHRRLNADKTTVVTGTPDSGMDAGAGRAQPTSSATRPVSWAPTAGPASVSRKQSHARRHGPHRHSNPVSPTALDGVGTPPSSGPDSETPSRHASNLMELAECSIEEASVVEVTAGSEATVHRMLSPRRRLLDSTSPPSVEVDTASPALAPVDLVQANLAVEHSMSHGDVPQLV
eukprot:m.37529 g.37529  ORF g.37529 m.37529 type:complete len:600 (+) comp5546_c0_seq1:156-1955(+)